jgi:hypothetical protein
MPRNYIKRGLSLLTLIGITSTVGSIQHGSLSLASLNLAVYSLAGLIIVNATETK